MKANALILRGYYWATTPHGWKVYFHSKLIGEGSASTGKCKHPKSREIRRNKNRQAAREFAKVDFVKRRIKDE